MTEKTTDWTAAACTPNEADVPGVIVGTDAEIGHRAAILLPGLLKAAPTEHDPDTDRRRCGWCRAVSLPGDADLAHGRRCPVSVVEAVLRGPGPDVSR